MERELPGSKWQMLNDVTVQSKYRNTVFLFLDGGLYGSDNPGDCMSRYKM